MEPKMKNQINSLSKEYAKIRKKKKKDYSKNIDKIETFYIKIYKKLNDLGIIRDKMLPYFDEITKKGEDIYYRNKNKKEFISEFLSSFIDRIERVFLKENLNELDSNLKMSISKLKELEKELENRLIQKKIKKLGKKLNNYYKYKNENFKLYMYVDILEKAVPLSSQLEKISNFPENIKEVFYNHLEDRHSMLSLLAEKDRNLLYGEDNNKCLKGIEEYIPKIQNSQNILIEYGFDIGSFDEYFFDFNQHLPPYYTHTLSPIEFSTLLKDLIEKYLDNIKSIHFQQLDIIEKYKIDDSIKLEWMEPKHKQLELITDQTPYLNLKEKLKHQELNLDLPIYGLKLNEEQKEKILKTGELGLVSGFKNKDKEFNLWVSLDKNLNEVVTKLESDINVNKIFGVITTEEQRERLKEGGNVIINIKDKNYFFQASATTGLKAISEEKAKELKLVFDQKSQESKKSKGVNL